MHSPPPATRDPPTQPPRLLWSRSPHATAELFAALKAAQDEPDPATAALVGVPLADQQQGQGGQDAGTGAPGASGGMGGPGAALGAAAGPSGAAAGGGGGGGGTAVLESVVNQPAIELLRRLPGVTGEQGGQRRG